MPNNLSYIDDLLSKHHFQSHDGLVDKPPSRLNVGEGTEKSFYILKIDVCNSTGVLLSANKSSYLRFAHTFLSTVDQIMKDCGADSEQTEYAGDSVIAYFPDNVPVQNVLVAATYARKAVTRMPPIGRVKLTCKFVLHYAPLIVAKIGPRAGSFISAIGIPIHIVAKMEKEVPPDTGRVTKIFFESVEKAHRKYIKAAYKEVTVENPAYVPPPPLSSTERIANALYGLNSAYAYSIQQALQPQYITESKFVGYNLDWTLLDMDLGLV